MFVLQKFQYKLSLVTHKVKHHYYLDNLVPLLRNKTVEACEIFTGTNKYADFLSLNF